VISPRNKPQCFRCVLIQKRVSMLSRDADSAEDTRTLVLRFNDWSAGVSTLNLLFGSSSCHHAPVWNFVLRVCFELWYLEFHVLVLRVQGFPDASLGPDSQESANRDQIGNVIGIVIGNKQQLTQVCLSRSVWNPGKQIQTGIICQ